MFDRALKPHIEKALWQGKVIILYGPRQVGKTTLARAILADYPKRGLYLNCDEPDVAQSFSGRSSTEMKAVIGKYDLVVLDEAQRVSNIGLSLKLLVDTYPGIQIIATGSSSFELSDQITEPLTGRNVLFTLFPLAEGEIIGDSGLLGLRRTLEERLLFGSYPEVVAAPDLSEKEERIRAITRDYLFKDILSLQQVKKATGLQQLLQALALQIGNEVSTRELSALVGLDKATVDRYLNVLEQSFIIYRLGAFSRNLRKEIGKRCKYYFVDIGIRNSLIANFNPLALRSDVGALWENYLFMERLKANTYRQYRPNYYFWRTYDGQEIDLIEESGGSLSGYELKFAKQRYHAPRIFLENYPGSKVELVTKNNYLDFLAIG